MSAALVFGTWNPSGTSYYDWVISSRGGLSPAQVFTGILILSVAVAFLRNAFLSLGYLGTLTILVLIIMAIVLSVGLGIVDFKNVSFSAYMTELWISLTMAIGGSWAYAQ